MKKALFTALLMTMMFIFVGCSRADDRPTTGEVVHGIPVKNTVTLVDLGAKTCVPCKLMAPILEELREEYKGRAEVVFIDVWDQDNRNKVKAFKIISIPTQIFYDKQGAEVYRHLGFLDKESIVAKLEELLAK